jgi:hypothetical protein
MPTVASVTVTFSRKYQIRRDNWVGLEAMVTMRVDEAEANALDPQSVLAEAFFHARAAIAEQQQSLRQELAAAQARAQEQRRLAEVTDGAPTPAGSAPPATAAEAEQRFYARYGQQIGGDTWAAVESFLARRLPKPTTIDEWFAVAAAVRDHARAQVS